MDKEPKSNPATLENPIQPATETRDLITVPQPDALPIPAPTLNTTPVRRRWLRLGLALAVLIVAGGGGYYWWWSVQPRLPADIGYGNGRIEADEIDIDTKFPGRIAEMLADEGDIVKAGQVVARMDTRDIEASLKKSQAQVSEAQRAIEEAEANVVQLKTQVVLAQQELDRAATLLQKGFQTREVMDQRQQTLNAANAMLQAAQARVIEARQTMEASTHDVELYQVNIADNTLVAPKDGRIQYRIANLGEVLPAGGKVFTMIDIGYVYMDVYLPTAVAGRIKLGSDARIVLDAFPKIAIPAKVSFIATEAQFTPKTVETKSERDILMFRVRAKIDPELLKAHAADVRSGLPGVTYFLLDSKATWPPALQGIATR
jgi:HlyD family secretion protein